MPANTNALAIGYKQHTRAYKLYHSLAVVGLGLLGVVVPMCSSGDDHLLVHFGLFVLWRR